MKVEIWSDVVCPWCYIGKRRFESALAQFAHRYRARIFVTMNTIMHDAELDLAREQVWQLYEAGVDALIVQDMGLLELDLPPIQLHASTQCDIRSVEKAKFLGDAGFSQLVLARELTIEQIRAIRVIPVRVRDDDVRDFVRRDAEALRERVARPNEVLRLPELDELVAIEPRVDKDNAAARGVAQRPDGEGNVDLRPALGARDQRRQPVRDVREADGEDIVARRLRCRE